MKPEISESDFAALVRDAGLPLSPAQTDGIRHAYGLFQTLIARVCAPLPREAEPALIFNPEIR
jgi:hypothetical protein